MPTIAEISIAFDTALEKITALDESLAVQSEALEQKAFEEQRDLTPEENAKYDAIATAREKLGDALEKLALVTIDGLEQASDFDTQIGKINAINEELTEALEHLNTLVEVAEKTAVIATGLATVAEKLLALRPSPI